MNALNTSVKQDQKVEFKSTCCLSNLLDHINSINYSFNPETNQYEWDLDAESSKAVSNTIEGVRHSFSSGLTAIGLLIGTHDNLDPETVNLSAIGWLMSELGSALNRLKFLSDIKPKTPPKEAAKEDCRKREESKPKGS